MDKVYVTISICFHNQVEITQKCLHLLRANTPRDGVEYIFSDNASTDQTRTFLANCDLPNKTVVIYPQNLGYQVPHNEALKLARGDFFIVMNNDIYIRDKDWLLKVLTPLRENKDVALVGLKGNPDSLDADGNGYVGGMGEYVEGSLLAARTADLRQYGLFNPAMKKYYFEDSDLSLRFRQMGYQIEFAKVEYEHIRGATSNNVNKEEIEQARSHNQAIWKRRWDFYVRNRTFTNKILIKANSAGIGDVLAVTPVLEALRRDHPTAKFVVETTCPDIFQHNPFVGKIVKSSGTSTVHAEVFDRVIDLMPPPHEGRGFRFASYTPFCYEAEKEAATKLLSPFPKLYMTRKELDYGARQVKETAERAGCEYENVVGVSVLMHRTSWQGRSWSEDERDELVRSLVARGIGVLEIGKGIKPCEEATLNLVDETTLREFFSIIANLPYLITVDSLPLWVAQAFKIPTYCIFGATEPIAKILDFSKVFLIRNEGLECLGCYQRKGDPGFNKCDLGYEACMRGVKAERVLTYLEGKRDGIQENFKYLHNLAKGRFER